MVLKMIKKKKCNMLKDLADFLDSKNLIKAEIIPTKEDKPKFLFIGYYEE